MISTGEQAHHRRILLGMNQSEFWERVGSSQSAGSRYEDGRDIPRPIQLLLTIAYIGNAKARNHALKQLRGWES